MRGTAHEKHLLPSMHGTIEIRWRLFSAQTIKVKHEKNGNQAQGYDKQTVTRLSRKHEKLTGGGCGLFSEPSDACCLPRRARVGVKPGGFGARGA